MYLKRFLSWQKYRKELLFKDVYIEDENIKKSIVDWLTRLHKNNILIDKFSFLFSEYKKISFPIRIYGKPYYSQITDANENQYYLCYNPYSNIDSYSIGERTKLFDTELTYQITTSQEIILKQFVILQLNSDGTNANNAVTFYYDLNSSTTTVNLETKLQNSTVKVSITYESLDVSHDSEIFIEFFNSLIKINEINNIFELSEHLLIDMEKILESKSILETESIIKLES